MATHSSVLAGKIPWTEEPGELWSMLLQRVRHNLVTEHACMPLHCKVEFNHWATREVLLKAILICTSNQRNI